MKRSLPALLFLMGLGFNFLQVTPASAQTPLYPFSFSWDITQASKYLFQGIDYSNGKPVAQPELALAYKDFSFISWLNFNQDEKVFDEIDLYFQYSREVQNLSLTPGYAYYRYPTRGDGWDPSQEVYLDISYDTFLSPTLSTHYDFDAGKGYYFTLGVSHGIETSRGIFGLGSNVFYQSDYYDATGFPSVEFNGSYSHSIGSMTIAPSISYFLTWNNGDFKDTGSVPEAWLFSINVSQSF